MKKRIFAFVAMLCVAVAGHGQYFEWAKGFASQQSDNAIVGTVADSAGNLYILANFRNDAVWDDSLRLLPIAPYGPAHNNINTMIAKMTPDGNIAWRKVVHANNGADSYAWDIKMIGDTSFAVTLSTRMPSWESEYLYWLDTLVAGVSDYPVPQGNMAGTSISAFVVFGFDGTVKEQHFLHMTAIDNDGYDIYFMHSLQEGLFPLYLSELKFDVDGDGNIYICYPMHYITDSAYSATLGTITAVKIWVDQHVVGIIDVDTSSRLKRPALLKFSPHFDTLINNREIIQIARPNETPDYATATMYLKIDRESNIYAIMNRSEDSRIYEETLIFDSTSHIQVTRNFAVTTKGIVIIFDSSFNVLKAIHIQDSILDTLSFIVSGSPINGISFDYDSNKIFVVGTLARSYVCDTNNVNNMAFVDGQPVYLMNDCYMLKFELSTLRFLDYSKVHTKCGCQFLPEAFERPGVATKNNRIFMQPVYSGGIYFPDRTYLAPSKYYWGSGLVIMDYAGNVIGGHHYNNFSTTGKSHPGEITMVDSVLYMDIHIDYPHTFGDISITDYQDMATIIKYIDTAFLTPYRPQPTGVVTVLPEGDIVIAPNPAHNEISVMALDAPAKGVFITSTDGKRQEARLLGGKIDISHLPQGVYFLEIVTENDKYTTKFIKQ